MPSLSPDWVTACWPRWVKTSEQRAREQSRGVSSLLLLLTMNELLSSGQGEEEGRMMARGVGE
jgi:hypothetical protein